MFWRRSAGKPDGVVWWGVLDVARMSYRIRTSSDVQAGKTTLPINKVGAMTRALGLDPANLLRIVMTEYMPEAWAVIEEVVGESILREAFAATISIQQSGPCQEQVSGMRKSPT